MRRSKLKNDDSSVFDKYLDKEKDRGRIFARIDGEVFDQFHKIRESENLKIQDALTVALKLFIDYYQKKKG